MFREATARASSASAFCAQAGKAIIRHPDKTNIVVAFINKISFRSLQRVGIQIISFYGRRIYGFPILAHFELVRNEVELIVRSEMERV